MKFEPIYHNQHWQLLQFLDIHQLYHGLRPFRVYSGTTLSELTDVMALVKPARQLAGQNHSTILTG